MSYVKSPLNYTGGKYKNLKDIIPLMPDNIDTFIDLFGGGFNVGANINANLIVYNDILPQLVSLMTRLYHCPMSSILDFMDETIKKYNLSKENAEGFTLLRKEYNSTPDIDAFRRDLLLYCLICYSFNNQIRFNQKGEYNMPFGKNRSSFNDSLREKLIIFCSAIQQKQIRFCNANFLTLPIDKLTQNDFVYCDPPYYSSVATYNEKGGWGEQEENDLLQLLDTLTVRGVKWGLSNNLKYDNPLLQDFIKKYEVIYLGNQHNNCNYHKKDKAVEDIEIFVKNY